KIVPSDGQKPKPPVKPGGFTLIPLVASERSPFADVVSIGRASENDVVLEHATVSKIHAIVGEDGPGVFWIADQGSRNGTYVGGARLVPKERHKLSESELVLLGDLEVMVKSPRALYRLLDSLVVQQRPDN